MTFVYVVLTGRDHEGQDCQSAGTDRDQAFAVADKYTRDDIVDNVTIEIWHAGRCIEMLRRPTEYGTQSLVYERSILSASGNDWQDAPSYERTRR